MGSVRAAETHRAAILVSPLSGRLALPARWASPPYSGLPSGPRPPRSGSMGPSPERPAFVAWLNSWACSSGRSQADPHCQGVAALELGPGGEDSRGDWGRTWPVVSEHDASGEIKQLGIGDGSWPRYATP